MSAYCWSYSWFRLEMERATLAMLKEKKRAAQPAPFARLPTIEES